MIPNVDEPYMQRNQIGQRHVSERLFGPNDFEASTLSSPWSGRLKNNGKQNVDDYDTSGMLPYTSFDSETKFPRVQTPGVLRRIGRYVPPHES